MEAPVRLWTDDSGSFRVDAQLIEVLDGKVRLLKTNGRQSTVPLDRLSQADRDYVDQFLAQQDGDYLLKFAAR